MGKDLAFFIVSFSQLSGRYVEKLIKSRVCQAGIGLLHEFFRDFTAEKKKFGDAEFVKNNSKHGLVNNENY